MGEQQRQHLLQQMHQAQMHIDFLEDLVGSDGDNEPEEEDPEENEVFDSGVESGDK